MPSVYQTSLVHTRVKSMSVQVSLNNILTYGFRVASVTSLLTARAQKIAHRNSSATKELQHWCSAHQARSVLHRHHCSVATLAPWLLWHFPQDFVAPLESICLLLQLLVNPQVVLVYSYPTFTRSTAVSLLVATGRRHFHPE